MGIDRCGLCGSAHETTREAMDCCSEKFDDEDEEDGGPPIPLPDGGFDYGEKREDGQYENYPTIDEGEFEQEPRATYVHVDGCGQSTTMTGDLPESVARDPTYYTKTFCTGCGEHVLVEEVEWEDGEDWVVDSDDPETATDGGFVRYQELIGLECPECDETITRGSLRWNGREWEHKNLDHPQAGHHVFDPTGIGEPEPVTDGGVVREHRTEALSLAHAGVGEQAGGCPHGSEDCTGPGGPGLSCPQCFFDGGDSDE